MDMSSMITTIRWKIQNPKSNQRTQSTHEQYSKKTLALRKSKISKDIEK